MPRARSNAITFYPEATASVQRGTPCLHTLTRSVSTCAKSALSMLALLFSTTPSGVLSTLNCSTAALADPIRPVSKMTDTSSIVKRLPEEEKGESLAYTYTPPPEEGRDSFRGGLHSLCFRKVQNNQHKIHDDKHNVDNIARWSPLI